ncbi:MAG TPA: cytochrome P450 [Herpetosiphonaceae bacterium]
MPSDNGTTATIMASLVTSASSIPGPRGLPLIGGRARLLTLYRNPFGYLRQLHSTYGDVVALAAGDPSYMFVFGPELNRHLLAHADRFENTVGPFFSRLPRQTAFGRLMVNNLAVMNGAHHRQQRRLMQPAFHHQQIAHYHADMVALTGQMLERWRPGTALDVLTEMRQLTQRIAVKTLFGVDDTTELDRVGRLLQRIIAISQSPLVLLAPANLPGLPFHRFNRLVERLEGYIRSLIERKRAQRDTPDVLAALVRAHDEDGSQLSDDELVGHAFTLFVAGHETTANALTWTLFLLDQHPRVLADVVDELEREIGDRAPTVEDLGRLSLLEGVIKESLRLLPPAPIGIRVASAPSELGGYAVPKGATIIFSEFITHRMPQIYAEPDRFLPERWAALHPSPYAYLPFAAGPHLCIGWAFAMQELRVVLAMLLRRFRVAVVPGSIVEPMIGMRPAHGLPVTVHAQDRQFRASPVRGGMDQLVDLPASAG